MRIAFILRIYNWHDRFVEKTFFLTDVKIDREIQILNDTSFLSYT